MEFKETRVCFISLTGYYFKQNMLHSAVNVSFNLLIFFPASPVKIIFHDPSSISFPKYLISLQYNKAKKKKFSSDLWNQSQHFILIIYFFFHLGYT